MVRFRSWSSVTGGADAAAMSHTTPDQRVGFAAARQYGYVTLAQAIQCGLSPTQVRRRVVGKGWRWIARGLYQLPGAPSRSWRGAAMAGCLLAGPEARAS